MTLSGHTSIINNAVWHPDSRHVASASDDGTVRIWDAETGKEIYRIDVGSRVYAVAWSPDGKQFAYGGIEGVVHIIPSPLMDATPEATPAP
jgi:WD40 repeat protein